MIYKKKGVFIKANEIEIGEGVTFGKNVDIRCVDRFEIGDRSHLGDDVRVRGRIVKLGADLYHSRGLDVGGGGCDRPGSILEIGDRCTIHDNHINIAEPVRIQDDVGLSPAVTIYTHGFWWSVLEGFPAEFRLVFIMKGSIIGYRTLILPGVVIEPYCVVGAQSVVTKRLPGHSICAGVPAKKIRDITPLTEDDRTLYVERIVDEYREIAAYHGLKPKRLDIIYPFVYVNDCWFDVERLEFSGVEDEVTDSWRDHARRYGLRWYSKRPFMSALRW